TWARRAMSTDPAQTSEADESATALEALAGALRRLAEGSSLDDTLAAIADAASAATGAGVAVVRVLDESGASLEARAVSASSTSVAAEWQRSRTAPSAGGDVWRATGHRLGHGAAFELPSGVAARGPGRPQPVRR